MMNKLQYKVYLHCVMLCYKNNAQKYDLRSQKNKIFSTIWLSCFQLIFGDAGILIQRQAVNFTNISLAAFAPVDLR